MSERILNSDAELVELFQSTRADEAFNRIVLKYQERMYLLARRFVQTHDEADDIVQEAFVRAHGALANFHGDSSLYTWLYRITTNIALNYLRTKKVRRFIRLDALAIEPSNPGGPEEESEENEKHVLIRRAIEKLPPKQRIVFTLRYFEEMPYEEMSRVLKTSEGALKASYFHAVKKIGKELRKAYGADS